MICAEKLMNIMYSPEFVARLLHRFLSGSQSIKKIGIKYELMYFLIPIVMNDKLRRSLDRAKKNSNFEQKLITDDNRSELYYLDEYIENTRTITNQGLIYLSSYANLSIGSYIKSSELVGFDSDVEEVKEYYRAAYYLGVLLSKEEYLNVFLKTKVKCI